MPKAVDGGSSMEVVVVLLLHKLGFVVAEAIILLSRKDMRSY